MAVVPSPPETPVRTPFLSAGRCRGRPQSLDVARSSSWDGVPCPSRERPPPKRRGLRATRGDVPQGLSWRTEDRAQWARSAVGRGLSVVPWKSLRLSPDPRNTNPPAAQVAGLFLPPPRFCGPPSPVCPAGHPKVSAAQAAERAGASSLPCPAPQEPAAGGGGDRWPLPVPPASSPRESRLKQWG